ncbi:hypothetical protein E2C01_084453 [Portunus trituberculatus]|uniref:Uncharacterized protein n=1 Tax=Portunus trituberculatus TaxID=210409 RepID=A0A5B7J010_PORTR|nr:hypothetical protein [Portunus trituberculatus]
MLPRTRLSGLHLRHSMQGVEHWPSHTSAMKALNLSSITHLHRRQDSMPQCSLVVRRPPAPIRVPNPRREVRRRSLNNLHSPEPSLPAPAEPFLVPVWSTFSSFIQEPIRKADETQQSIKSYTERHRKLKTCNIRILPHYPETLAPPPTTLSTFPLR